MAGLCVAPQPRELRRCDASRLQLRLDAALIRLVGEGLAQPVGAVIAEADLVVLVVSGGQPEFIPLLSRAAVAAGIDGVFMEVHQNPSSAKSDAQNALALDLLPALIDKLVQIHQLATRTAVTR